MPFLVGLLWIALTVALFRRGNQLESAATIVRFGPGWFAVVILGVVAGFMLGWSYIKYIGRVSTNSFAKASGLFLASFAAVVIFELAVISSLD